MGTEQFVLTAIDDLVSQGALDIAQRTLDRVRITLSPELSASAQQRICAAGGGK